MDYFKHIIEKFFASSSSILIVGGLIVVANLVWFLPTVSSLRENVSEREKAAVKIALIQIESFLETKEKDVRVSARFVKEKLDDPENALLMQKILKEEHFSLITLSDTNGNEIIKYDKFKTMLRGDVKNILAREDFKETIKTEKISWSKVFVSEKFEPLIILNVPVFSAKKEIIGVVSATLSVSPIFKALSNVDVGQGKVYVVDSKGTLISDLDLSLVLKGVNYSNRKIVSDALSKPSEIITVANDNTYVYKNAQGVSMLAAATKIPDTNWVVVFEESKSEAVASITRLTVFAFGSFLIVSFLVFMMRKTNLKLVSGRKELEKNFLVQQELFNKAEGSKKEIETANSHLKEKDVKLGEKIAELEKFQKFVVDREVRMIELKQEIAALKKNLDELKLSQ